MRVASTMTINVSIAATTKVATGLCTNMFPSTVAVRATLFGVVPAMPKQCHRNTGRLRQQQQKQSLSVFRSAWRLKKA